MSDVKSGIPRAIEFIAALLGLIIAAPLMVIAVVLTATTSKGPVLFRQKRVGRDGRLFLLYKFRTMRIQGSGPQVTARGDARITSVGRLLRKSKIDESPELWNVLKGDMSLVGPRPEVPKYVNQQDPIWRQVLRVRPGLTDPMTVKLRNEEQLLAAVSGDVEAFYLKTLQPYKLRGYIDYLNSRSCWTDIAVLWRTGIAVVNPDKAPVPELSDLSTDAGQH